ncbi:MAG TPA: helix-turn-helix transcriptional regulator [Pseudonocardiaceae bacterium]|nr:helix-turn-helix transcriptional regulator [Pseudonocardiaceae bacterium]
MGELGAFLRSRRAMLTPSRVGLTPHGVRRVPGLRREEVARLAAISADYYARLERGRVHTVSETVLDALAQALRLDDTDRAHLFTLARIHRRRRTPPPQHVRPGLLRLLDSATMPALVLGRRQDVLAGNALAQAVFTDFAALPPRRRNLARFIFLDDTARTRYADWPTIARATVTELHRYGQRQPYDPRLAELVGELSLRDNDFRTWWAEGDAPHAGRVQLRHPLVGELTLHHEALTTTDDPEQTLMLYPAQTGSVSEDNLALLASWTLQDRAATWAM